MFLQEKIFKAFLKRCGHLNEGKSEHPIRHRKGAWHCGTTGSEKREQEAIVPIEYAV